MRPLHGQAPFCALASHRPRPLHICRLAAEPQPCQAHWPPTSRTSTPSTLYLLFRSPDTTQVNPGCFHPLFPLPCPQGLPSIPEPLALGPQADLLLRELQAQEAEAAAAEAHSSGRSDGGHVDAGSPAGRTLGEGAGRGSRGHVDDQPVSYDGRWKHGGDGAGAKARVGVFAVQHDCAEGWAQPQVRALAPL